MSRMWTGMEIGAHVRPPHPSAARRPPMRRLYPIKPSTLNICRTVLGTTTQWLRGHGMLGDQFPSTVEGQKQLHERVAIAQKHGYHPSANDVYDPTVAQFPGDPRGFISSSDPVGHVRRVCEETGTGCDSDLVKVPAPPADPGPNKRLADDIVQREVSKRVAKDPGLAHGDQTALREAVIEKHGFTG
jgi:hypothetical protein